MALSGSSFAAEKFPSREIIIVVPWTAGGATDLGARVLAEQLKKDFRIPVVVENRTEAGGVKGILDVYKAKPDGYTLLGTLLPRMALMEVEYKHSYRILDMTYLGAYMKQDMAIAVSKESPFKTLKELEEASKKKRLTCSTAGSGTLAEINAMMFKKKLGFNIEPVPFKGDTPATIALLGGNVDMTMAGDLTLYLQLDKIRVLAVISDKRSDKFPGVPCLGELGYNVSPRIGVSIHGITGPLNMPRDVRATLMDMMAKSMKNPEFINNIEKIGPTANYLSGPDYRTAGEFFYKFAEEYFKDIIGNKK